MQKTATPGFYKVDESLVINKDNEALAAYKKRKLKEKRIEHLQTEINELKTNITEIKELLQRLVK